MRCNCRVARGRDLRDGRTSSGHSLRTCPARGPATLAHDWRPPFMVLFGFQGVIHQLSHRLNYPNEDSWSVYSSTLWHRGASRLASEYGPLCVEVTRQLTHSSQFYLFCRFAGRLPPERFGTVLDYIHRNLGQPLDPSQSRGGRSPFFMYPTKRSRQRDVFISGTTFP
jgi:hypothetical protein